MGINLQGIHLVVVDIVIVVGIECSVNDLREIVGLCRFIVRIIIEECLQDSIAVGRLIATVGSVERKGSSLEVVGVVEVAVVGVAVELEQELAVVVRFVNVLTVEEALVAEDFIELVELADRLDLAEEFVEHFAVPD